MKVITIHSVQNIGRCTLFTGSLPRHSLWTTGTFLSCKQWWAIFVHHVTWRVFLDLMVVVTNKRDTSRVGGLTEKIFCLYIRSESARFCITHAAPERLQYLLCHLEQSQLRLTSSIQTFSQKLKTFYTSSIPLQRRIWGVLKLRLTN